MARHGNAAVGEMTVCRDELILAQRKPAVCKRGKLESLRYKIFAIATVLQG